MAVSGDDFKKALQFWASGVAVVTTKSEKYGIQGMTVTAFSSVSLNPPQILVCINKASDTGDGIKESRRFTVNILTTDQEDVSYQFSGGSSQQVRFENTDWEAGLLGTPVISKSIMSLDCTVVEIVHSGTHAIIIGEVQNAACRSGDPLLYYRGAYRKLTAE